MQPLSGNQRRDLLTALMNMSLALHLPRKMHLCRSSSNVPRLPSFWKCYKIRPFCSLLTQCTIPCACQAKRHLNVQKCSEPVTTACTFSTSQLPKVVRRWCALYILTSKCASHHNAVHFFDIATSESGLSIGVLCTF